MARYAFGMRSTVEGTNLRAQMSLFSILNVGGTVREVGVSNTTDQEFAVGLARFTDAANVGVGLVGGAYDENAPIHTMTIYAGHIGDGNVGRVLRQWSIGAAFGASVIWAFGDKGLIIQPGTAMVKTGIGPYIPTGNGQIGDDYIEWDE